MITPTPPAPPTAIIPPDPSWPELTEQTTIIVAIALIIIALAIMMLSAIIQMHRQTNNARQWTSHKSKTGKVFWKPKNKANDQ